MFFVSSVASTDGAGSVLAAGVSQTAEENQFALARFGEEDEFHSPAALILTQKKQLGRIAGCLISLSVLVNSDELATRHSKAETVKNITALSSLVHKLQGANIPSTELGAIQYVNSVITAAIAHLSTVIKTYPIEFAPFDPAPAATRTVSVTTAEAEVEIAQKNSSTLKKLVPRIEVSGLKWYNRLYRRANDIYLWGERHHVTERTTLASAAIATGLMGWWAFDDKHFEENVPPAIYKLFGPCPIKDLIASQVNPLAARVAYEKKYGEYKLVGKGCIMVSQAISGAAVLAPLAWLAGYTYTGLVHEWASRSKKKFDDTVSYYSNKLKGGAYLKEAMRISQHIEKITFDDVVGLEHVKEHFRKILAYMANPEAFDRQEASIDKGILLVGDTRTGKSFCVKALANEIDRMYREMGRQRKFEYLEFTVSEIEQFGIANVVEVVRMNAPCVVFIDEIDLLNLQRNQKTRYLPSSSPL